MKIVPTGKPVEMLLPYKKRHLALCFAYNASVAAKKTYAQFLIHRVQQNRNIMRNDIMLPYVALWFLSFTVISVLFPSLSDRAVGIYVALGWGALFLGGAYVISLVLHLYARWTPRVLGKWLSGCSHAWIEEDELVYRELKQQYTLRGRDIQDLTPIQNLLKQLGSTRRDPNAEPEVTRQLHSVLAQMAEDFRAKQAAAQPPPKED